MANLLLVYGYLMYIGYLIMLIESDLEHVLVQSRL